MIQQASHIIRMTFLLLLIFSCSVSDDIRFEENERQYVYFMVTHGPTTDVGFWGDVFEGTQEKADELNVDVIPLHPIIESSGELLNAQMEQAILADPPGILATIWGDGMPEVVQAANSASIPVAAINVYPDPEFFGPGKAEFLFYSGQNDSIVGIDGSNAIICASEGERLINGLCNGISPESIYDSIVESEQIAVVCIIHQQSGGVISRCNAAQNLFINDYGHSQNDFYTISWDESVPGSSVEAIETFFNQSAIANYHRLFIMANGPVTIDAYNTATIPQVTRDKATIGTFNTSSSICTALLEGEVAYASSQGQDFQGKMALDYLHYYILHGDLPPEGVAPDGSTDERWTVSPDGYPWYKTGPTLYYDACP
ncbi:hypothetical protein [Pleionea sediminis]|uniref:hypothetical protein n=1 Tax=Pleionea sediminis TaxID=2569479 RepID=UPI001184F14C|nr:hypothetical protein [Pleionea sediminis]